MARAFSEEAAAWGNAFKNNHKKNMYEAHNFFKGLTKEDYDDEVLKHLVTGVATLGDPLFLTQYVTLMMMNKPMMKTFERAYEKLYGLWRDMDNSFSTEERDAMTAILSGMNIALSLGVVSGTLYTQDASVREEMTALTKRLVAQIQRASSYDEVQDILREAGHDPSVEKFLVSGATREKISRAMMKEPSLVRTAARMKNPDVFASVAVRKTGEPRSDDAQRQVQRQQEEQRRREQRQQEQRRQAERRAAPKPSRGIRQRRKSPGKEEGGPAPETLSEVVTQTIEQSREDGIRTVEQFKETSAQAAALPDAMNAIADKLKGNAAAAYYAWAINILMTMSILITLSEGNLALALRLIIALNVGSITKFLYWGGSHLMVRERAQRALAEEKYQEEVREEVRRRGGVVKQLTAKEVREEIKERKKRTTARFDKPEWRWAMLFGGQLLTGLCNVGMAYMLPRVYERAAAIGEEAATERAPMVMETRQMEGDPDFVLDVVQGTIGLVAGFGSVTSIQRYKRQMAKAISRGYLRSRTQQEYLLGALSVGGTALAGFGTWLGLMSPAGAAAGIAGLGVGAVAGFWYDVKQDQRSAIAELMQDTPSLITTGGLALEIFRLARYSAPSEAGTGIGGEGFFTTPGIPTDWTLFAGMAGLIMLHQAGSAISIAGAHGLGDNARMLLQAEATTVALGTAFVVDNVVVKVVQTGLGAVLTWRNLTNRSLTNFSQYAKGVRSSLKPDIEVAMAAAIDENQFDLLDLDRHRKVIAELQAEIDVKKQELDDLDEDDDDDRTRLTEEIAERKRKIEWKKLIITGSKGIATKVATFVDKQDWGKVNELLVQNYKQQQSVTRPRVPALPAAETLGITGGQTIGITGARPSPRRGRQEERALSLF